jgi:hypothetical protein
MTTRQVREGRAVRLSDPIRHAVRCWDAQKQCIVGAGRVEFPRWVLDIVGTIVATADLRRRVLIGWPMASIDGELVAGGDAGLWVDVDQLEPVKEDPRRCAEREAPAAVCRA